MGEYIRKGQQEVKLGTCESLYYMAIPQFLKSWNSFGAAKHHYINPKNGYRFRFPFPDEYIGRNWVYPENIHDFSRCEPLDIEWTNVAGEKGTLGLIQERIVNNRIEPIFKLVKDEYGAFRVDDKEFYQIVKAIKSQCAQYRSTQGSFEEKMQAMKRARFLTEIVERMVVGWNTDWHDYFSCLLELKEAALKAK